MQNFFITTESSCDLSRERLSKFNIKQIPFKVLLCDKEYNSTTLSPARFFSALREGEQAKTSAINMEAYKEFFEEKLERGDLLHITLSSGLSASYGCACMAAEELREKYPQRKIEIIDSLGGSLGQGLLAELCAKKRGRGYSISQTAAFAKKIAVKIAHQFTVSDLGHLKRGGRISGAVACVGTLLNIKPVLKASDEGKLVTAGKIRGKAAAIKHLCDEFIENADALYSDTPIFISHADCINDAQALKEQLKRVAKNREIYVNDIGALMGAHCGPDTLAIFYICKER